MKIKAALLAVSLVLGLGLAACETETPYQPIAKANKVSGGFADQRLDDNHFQVSFQGNTVTSRERVETYLLYRAAEVAVSQGFDWFEMVDRRTVNDQQTYITGYGFSGPGYGYWHPYWRYHGAWGWHGGGWGGWGWDDYDVHTIDQYQATAEIAVYRGPKPPGNPKAFDARQVMSNLAPNIIRPVEAPAPQHSGTAPAA
jgi:hypothetical protein